MSIENGGWSLAPCPCIDIGVKQGVPVVNKYHSNSSFVTETKLEKR